MFQNFTRRHHLDKPKYVLKYQYIPSAFRFDIYKSVVEDCESIIEEYCIYRDTAISVNKESFRAFSSDEIEEYYNPDMFIDLIMSLEWHEVLSAIEFFVSVNRLTLDEANSLFAYHNIGYEIDKGIFPERPKVVVKYDELIEDNDNILSLDIKYESVKDSITSAKRYLIDPNNIDIANSIKSSISAIEGFLKGMLIERDKKVSTLGDCIKELKKMNEYPDRIIIALEQLYIYRNSEKNIGHGAPEHGDYSVEDALLCNDMAVSFINYFFKKDRT